MATTHDSLAVQAFKKAHGRPPTRSIDERQPDEAWIQAWKSEHVAQLIRQRPGYDHYHAIRTSWRDRRRKQRRLKKAAVPGFDNQIDSFVGDPRTFGATIRVKL